MRAIISNLLLVGYNGALSIEHEDGLMSKTEGFEKAAAFLNHILITQEAGRAFWADGGA